LIGNCKHFEICGLPDDADPESGLCILHAKKPGKSIEKFAAALETHRKKNGNNFSYIVFPEYHQFVRAVFAEEANFSGATFTEIADFSKATFTKEVNFLGVTFNKMAIFHGATFTMKAVFHGIRFSDVVDFSNATFTEGVGFISATFTDVARFHETRFIGEVYFQKATFNKEALFLSANFNGESHFNLAIFTEQANFSGAGFTKGVDFSDAKFGEEINFVGTIFHGANFYKAIFSGGGNFQEAAFKGGLADFRFSLLQGKTLFSSRREGNQVIPIFSGVEVNFKQVVIDPPDGLALIEADLSKCLFQDTDLQKVRFTGVTWRRIHGRLGVYDETFLEKGKAGPWERVERLYRELKKNYEEGRDYERAGHFHYGEKEMRRRNPEAPFGLRFLLTLYWLVSGYGERCWRPLFWIVALWAISTFGYLKWGLLEENEFGQPLFLTSWWDWLSAIIYSFRVTMLLKPTNFMPVDPLGTAINTIQSIIGPILIGLFALAVRQRLKR